MKAPSARADIQASPPRHHDHRGLDRGDRRHHDAGPLCGFDPALDETERRRQSRAMARPSHSSGWRARFATMLTRARAARSTVDDKKPDKTAESAARTRARSRRSSYELGDGGVVRTESRAGKVVRHETYSLSPVAPARFELRDEGSRRLVALVVTRPAGQEPDRATPAAGSGGADGKDRAGTAWENGRHSRDDRRTKTGKPSRGIDRGRGARVPDHHHADQRRRAQGGLAQRELARSQERRLQAEWLAESGAERAIARLATDRDYTGETWSLSAQDLGQSEQSTGTSPQSAATPVAHHDHGRARAGRPNRRRVHVQADYPLDPPRRARHTKRIHDRLEPSQEEPLL